MNPNQIPEPQSTPPTQPPVEPVAPTAAPAPFEPAIQPQPVFEPQTPPAYSPVEPAVAPGVSPAPAPNSFFGTPDAATTEPMAASVPSAKKPLNKKLIIIIAAVVGAVVIIGVVAAVLLPSITGKSSGGLLGTSSSAASLVAYEGTGYDISLPADFKVAPVGSSPTSSVINKFTKDGAEATGKTTTIGVIVSPFSATNTREQSISFFNALKSKAPADTEFSKDNKSEATTVAGFEALKASGTSLDNGVEGAKATGMYVLGNKNMYIISISVPAGADNSIDADAIINSFKPKE